MRKLKEIYVWASKVIKLVVQTETELRQEILKFISFPFYHMLMCAFSHKCQKPRPIIKPLITTLQCEDNN
jgi:hypothetical protein